MYNNFCGCKTFTKQQVAIYVIILIYRIFISQYGISILFPFVWNFDVIFLHVFEKKKKHQSLRLAIAQFWNRQETSHNSEHGMKRWRSQTHI